jgi:chromosomal replication initiation ATPase DnaA
MGKLKSLRLVIPEAIAALGAAESPNPDPVQRRPAALAALDRLNLPITATDQRLLLDGKLDPKVKALEAVASWLPSPVPWLMLLGSTGRGKTLAAGWALVQRGGRYVGARELERVATARYGDEAELFSKLLETRLLVVDDIGRERDAGNMTAALLDLVDERRKRGQKTIAIANIAKAAFLELYADERLLSRLNEPGIAAWIADTGPDLRARKP